MASLMLMPAYAAPKKPMNKKDSAKKSRTTTTNPARQWDIHNIAVWGGVGYSGLVNQYPNVPSGIGYSGDFSNRFVGGGGGLIGVGYEYKYKRFIMSVGPEFRIFSSTDKLQFSSSYGQALSQYNQIKYYQFNNLRENQAIGQIMVPILFGGTFDAVYFKAGAKIGYTIVGNYHQKGLLTTTIFDPDAYDPEWVNINSHGAFTDANFDQKGKNPYGLDVALSAEVGVNIDKLLSKGWQEENEKRERSLRMRVALFADYGVVNMNVGSAERAFASTTEQEIATISLHQSEWATSSLNSLLVGIKFTAMLQMNKEKKLKKKTPLLNVYTTDEVTGKILAGTQVFAQPEKGKAKKKVSNGKGIAAFRLAEGDYTITATRSGYIPSGEISFSHVEDKEQLDIALTPIPVYSLFVRNAKTGENLVAHVRFVDLSTEKEVATATTDAATGGYSLALPMGSTYRVHVEANDFFAETGLISNLSATDSFLLQPIEKKKAIVLHNLYFATNKTTILPESEEALLNLYEMLVENSAVRIRIIGHTDAVGSDKDNQKLSEGRAESVRQNMIDRGIDPSRIEAIGKGKSEPIAPNDTEEGRAKNRRVEFVIL